VTVVALNAAAGATPVSFSLQNIGFTTGTATPYVTDGSRSTARQQAVPVTGGSLKATVPARSLVTYTVRR
jgi:glucosylceramidase